MDRKHQYKLTINGGNRLNAREYAFGSVKGVQLLDGPQKATKQQSSFQFVAVLSDRAAMVSVYGTVYGSYSLDGVNFYKAIRPALWITLMQ